MVGKEDEEGHTIKTIIMHMVVTRLEVQTCK